MHRNRSLHFALVASGIFLLIGYILAQMHSDEPIQIRVLPLKYPTGAEAMESPTLPNRAETIPLSVI